MSSSDFNDRKRDDLIDDILEEARRRRDKESEVPQSEIYETKKGLVDDGEESIDASATGQSAISIVDELVYSLKEETALGSKGEPVTQEIHKQNIATNQVGLTPVKKIGADEKSKSEEKVMDDVKIAPTIKVESKSMGTVEEAFQDGDTTQKGERVRVGAVSKSVSSSPKGRDTKIALGDTIVVDTMSATDSTGENDTGDDDVKQYVPPQSTHASLQSTRQFKFDSKTSKKLAFEKKANGFAVDEGGDLEQLDIEGLLHESSTAENKVSDSNDWENEFHRSREKKANKFKMSFKIAGDEEQNEPEEEYHSFADEELDDYKSYDETADVRNGLNYRRKIAWIRFSLTLVITIILLAFTIMSQFNIAVNHYFEAGASAFLLFVALILNNMTIGIGFRELFRLSPSSESVVALPAIATFLHTAGKLIPSNINDEKYVLWSVMGAGALLCGAIGELLMIRRISGNFKFVSYPKDKYALNIIRDDDLAVEIGRNTVALGTPSIVYDKKIPFLSHFLENSYERDVSDKSGGIMCYISLVISIVVAILYGVQHRSFWRGLSAFVLSLTLSLPIGSMTAAHLPIYRISQKILRLGGMIVGWQAARDFGDAHAVAVDAEDLFTSENVLLHGIKTFSGTRIDKAILDAAAVSIEAGGPLSFVFRRIIQENDGILPEVDTVVFEQDMGVSGWVDGRRVLIGNRTLLENHGVDAPSKDYEAKYAINGRKIAYLSVAGELSSMFVVSYIPDMHIARALDSLAKADVTLLVRTSDPNINEEFLCDVYDLDDYYVEVMKASSGRAYDGLVAETAQRAEAVAASNGRLEGLAATVSGCRKLGKAVKLGVVIQIIGAALGLALAILFVLFTAIVPSPLMVFLYSAGWLLLSWVAPACYKG